MAFDARERPAVCLEQRAHVVLQGDLLDTIASEHAHDQPPHGSSEPPPVDGVDGHFKPAIDHGLILVSAVVIRHQYSATSIVMA